MKVRSRHILFSLITLSVFVISLVSPTVAQADDSAPPETPPTLETQVPDQTGTAPVDTVAAPEAPVSVPEVLEQAPADTTIIVVNDDGQVEPLATTEAAKILQTGDPVWCPSGHAPGDAECTGSHTAMADLLDELSTDAGATYSGSGTIWIESTYDGTVDGSILLDQEDTSVYDLTYLSDLNIQGYQASVSDPTAPTIRVPFTIQNWIGNISLRNLLFDIDDSLNNAVSVSTDGTIDVNDVSVTNTSNSGASLNATSDISIANSVFDGNKYEGLLATSGGNIDLNLVSASGSNDPGGATGAVLDTCQFDADSGLCMESGSITVTDSTFSNNTADGLDTDSGATTELTNVTADSNGGFGAFAMAVDESGAPHDVIVTSGNFSNNSDAGLGVLSNGSVLLDTVIADNNGIGALVDTTPGEGDITVSGGEFKNNYDGLDAFSAGGITVNAGATFSDNAVDGAYLDNLAGSGDISVSDSTFNTNGDHGVFAITGDGNVSLSNLTVDGGGVTDVGAWIKAINGTATVDSGSFSNTTEVGLIAIGGTNVELINVTVTKNAGDGARAYSTYTYACFGYKGILVSVDGGTYSGNGGTGLTIKPGPDGIVEVLVPPDFTSVGLNGAGDMVVDLGNPCEGSGEENPGEGKPVHIVEVPFKDGEPVLQDCDIYSGTALVLPDGTWVNFGCPSQGSATLIGLQEEELPGRLGAGTQFVAGLTYGMTGLDGAVITVNPDGTFTIKFKIPEDSHVRLYEILYWDPTANNGAGAWITLPPRKFGHQGELLNPSDSTDARIVEKGVRQENGYVTVTVNFTGTFVLVSR
jgi:hypothetical protein